MDELHPYLQELLHKRKLGEEDLLEFFTPQSALVERSEESSSEALELARQRIQEAIDQREPVLVFGDYDVDGSCGTAILVRAIQRAGGDVRYFIPDRVKSGYGLSQKLVQTMGKKGFRLLITVDCGVRNIEEIRLARELGIESIVIDHHVREEELPEAFAIVHPGVVELPPRYAYLCGTALSYLVAKAWLPEEEALSFAPLLSLATVTDMVPLLRENRALVKKTLTFLEHSSLPGIRALFEVARCHERMDPQFMLGFVLGPRVNAAGRVGQASDAVELFLAETEERAKTLASRLDQKNDQRRKIQQQVYQEALPKAERQRDRSLLFLYGERWHLGVLGIVASRLAKEFGKPCLLAARVSDSLFKGSGRSIPGLPLLPLLEKKRELFERFGGHAQAVGFGLLEEKLEAAEEALDEAAASSPSPDGLVPELEVALHNLDDTFFAQYEKLAPFGPRFERPLFLSKEEVELRFGGIPLSPTCFLYYTLKERGGKNSGKLLFTLSPKRKRHLVIEKVL